MLGLVARVRHDGIEFWQRNRAKPKAAHKVSLADALVAATALRLKATLVHKDPDFESLQGVVSLESLPAKTAAQAASKG